jgi:uncharacterized protein YggE
MKNILILIFVVATTAVTAQHSKNQREFKKVVRTPRYRAGGGGQTQTNYYNNANANNAEQNAFAGPPPANEMVLQCAALMNVKADSYLAIFNLTQTGTTAKEADEIMAKRSAPFIESLKTLGIGASDIYEDMIYLIPTYHFEVDKKLFSKTYNEVPKGFEMQKNLHIRFKDAKIIRELVTLAAANEIYDLVTVEYFVNISQAVYDTLRAKSIAYLASNAKKYERLGLKLEGEFKVVSEDAGVVYPESQYTEYDAFVSQSLDAARDKSVTTMRKAQTVAYNKLDYDAFDIVINPQFLEPVVQFTFKLILRYTLNNEKIQPKNHYLLIDSNGNVKELPIK